MRKKNRRKWAVRILGCGCLFPVLLLSAALLVSLFIFSTSLDFPDEASTREALALQPGDAGYPVRDLDGFDSPYLGHTGSWDGKGGAMFGASKEPDLDREVSMGLRWTFMPVYWRVLEPNGPADLSEGIPPAWEALDAFVVAAHARNLNILMQAPVIGGNAGGPPDWAGRRQQGKSAPEDMNAAASFARKLVMRYKPSGVLAQREGWKDGYGVLAWELDNEPQYYRTNWNGQARDYAEFVTVVAQAIKAEDPNSLVLTPSYVSGGDSVAWLEETLGGSAKTNSVPAGRETTPYSIGPETDILSFHVYEGMNGTSVGNVMGDALAPFLRWQRVQDTTSPPGFACWHTEGNFDFLNITPEEDRANWVFQFFTRGFAAGAAKLNVMDATGTSEIAVRTYVKLLPNPFPMLEASSEVRVEEGNALIFRHTANDRPGNTWVAWALNGGAPARISIPSSNAQVYVYSVDGSMLRLDVADGVVEVDLPGGTRIASPKIIVDSFWQGQQ